MAFAFSGIRHVLSRPLRLGDALFPSLFSTRRLASTLTSPKLFVSGLSRMTKDDGLWKAFSPFGQLLEAKVIFDRVSGRSKGFGFISYATVDEAEKARQGLNCTYLDGWVIFVDPARPKEPPKPRPDPEPDTTQNGFRVNKTIGWCGSS